MIEDRRSSDELGWARALVVGLALSAGLAGCGRRWSVGVPVDDRAFELRLPSVVAVDLEGGPRIYALRGVPGSAVVGVVLRAPGPGDRALQQLTFAALADEAELAASRQGALFGAAQSDDGVAWYVQTTADARADLLAEQAALVRAPRHDPARIAALHDEHRAVIDTWSVEPLQIARSHVRSRVYVDGHPYAKPLIGRRDLARIGVDEIRGHHSALVRPAEAAVVVIADADPAALAAEARLAFSTWSEGQGSRDMSEGAGAGPPPRTDGAGPGPEVSRASDPAAAPGTGAIRPGPPALLLVEAPELPQTILVLERATLPRSDPDYVFLDLGAAVLGSVLHRRLREDRGLTYGVSVTLDAHRGPSPLTIATQVDPARADEALAEILGAFVDLQKSPVDAAVGDHFFPGQGLDAMLAVETGLGAAAWVGRGFLFDADARSADAELERLRVRAEAEVNRVMAATLRADAFTIAIVGDPKGLDAAAVSVQRPAQRSRLADVRAALLE